MREHVVIDLAELQDAAEVHHAEAVENGEEVQENRLNLKDRWVTIN